MQALNLKPTHKLVKSYYETLGQYGQLNIDYEGAVRSAFQALLRGCGHQFDWTLVPEYPIQRPKAHIIKVDGAMVDTFRLARGFWEAKDSHDILEKEAKAKFEKGYPKTNIIFQAPEKAILFQNGIRQGLNEDLRDDKNLVELLKVFFSYKEPHHEEWEQAVAEFKTLVPELAKAVEQKIEQQRRTNKAFVQTFDAFYDLCRQAINPNLSVEAVEKMLVQHLLTERIFRKIFDNPDFARRNVIAVEIEKIIDSMTAKEFSRDAFLKNLDHFYRAIELAAESTQDYSEKQKFINTVYERFFQGYSPKEADTHGIVYTPQPIVDFMVRSVEDILQKEFGRSLSDKGVHILDPFVGTGNFITRVMKEIKTGALPYKYENELHCNEVMLLPYYVASMNIEHEYMNRTGEYKPFPGICLVDTFELAEPEQSKLSFMTEANTERVRKQKQSPIFVVICNPPYNVGQDEQNDNNKNRKYPVVDKRVADTYAARSTASNKNSLSDAYVKAIRWATDRISDAGVVCMVTNNGFVEALACDGMRDCLATEFSRIYHLDLRGNARTTAQRRRAEGGNVFGDAIRVGVGITLFLKKPSALNHTAQICSVDDALSCAEKQAYLDEHVSLSKVPLENVGANPRKPWLRSGDESFDEFFPLGDKREKYNQPEAVFRLFGRGVATCRDAWAFNFSREKVSAAMRASISFYNGEIDRWIREREDDEPMVDEFVVYDDARISWSRDLKLDLERKRYAEFSPAKLRRGRYRPFTAEWVFFDRVMNEEVYVLPSIFPREETELENRAIAVTGHLQIPFSTQMVDRIPCLDVGGRPSQMFSLYTYDEDGTNRRENITDWALNEFRTHYLDANITKWDIFHYVYAVLHHPEYRTRYAANLKRELPRIPFMAAAEGGPHLPASGKCGADAAQETRNQDGFVSGRDFTTRPQTPSCDNNESGHDFSRADKNRAEGASSLPKASAQPQAERHKEIFWQFANAGKALADLHVNYEQQKEFPLERIEEGQLNYRVEKMRLSKDKTTLAYNDFLTLKGIPPETYEYRLGNRSALEWVIDQYQVSTDKRSGIVNDPNREDDPEYIVRLIGQVITVSLETMKIVKNLPEWAVDRPETTQ